MLLCALGPNHFQLGVFPHRYKSHCLAVGKAAFENKSNNLSACVYKGKLVWGFIRQSGFGWLQPAYSSDTKDVFQFVHDSIRQYLMAVWVAHLSLLEDMDLSQNGISDGLGSCANLKKVNFSHNNLSSIRDVLPFFPNLEEIDLSHNSISDEAVPGLAEGFGSCQNLKHVHLSNNKISNEGALLLLLQDQCKRVQVETAGNNISDDLMSQLSNRQNASQIAKLFLMPGKYPSGNVTALNFSAVNYLLQFLPRLPNLQELALCVSCQREEEAELIDQLYEVQPALKTLQLTLMNCSLDKMTRLLTLLLKQFPLLEAIDLSGSDIRDETAPALVEGLASGQNLKKVNLSYNKLSDRGDFLPPLPNLEEIDLSGNTISDEAVPGLAQGLGSCQNLKHVNLNNNKISNKGALLLLLQDQCKLVQVETSGNNICDDLMSLLSNRDNASIIAKLFVKPEEYPLGTITSLPFHAVNLLLQFLPQLPNLQVLGLCVSCQREEEADFIDQLYEVQTRLKSLRLTLRDCSLDKMTRLLTLMLQQFPVLEAIDLSGSDISDETVSTLVRGFGSCQKLKKVNLSHNKLSDRGDFLPPLPRLEEIDLSHNAISDEAVPGLAKGLGSCKKLKKVNLSHNKLSNRGDSLPPLPNLEEIDLSHNIISDEAVPGLAEGLGTCQNLKTVNLSGNMLSDRGDFLPPLPNLEEIDLSFNAISDNAVLGLAEGLGSCQYLKKVNLRYNKLSNRGDFLPPLPNLEEIDLSHNAISDKAVSGLAEGLASCQNLKKVNLSYNKLSNRGDFLPPLPNLEEIDLSHNAISDEAVLGLAKGITFCQSLNHIDITNNKISNKGALLLLVQCQLKRMQVETAGNNICNTLVCLLSNKQNAKRDLEEIDLSHCDLCDEAVPGLAQSLFSCQNLRKVNLTFNNLSDRGDFLPSLPNLEEIDLSHNAISDEAVPGLAEGLALCHKLKKVNLSHNKLSDRGDFLPPLPNLEEIDLSDNKISNEAVPGLFQSLGLCQNLKKVNLSFNKLSDRGDFLPPLPKLEEIDLRDNALSDQAVSDTAKGLASCRKLKTVNLSYNKFSGVRELIEAFINLPIMIHVNLEFNFIRDESLPTIAAWLKVRTDVERVWLWGNRFSAEGVRDFVRTMMGKAYSGYTLLYDGSQADIGEAVGSGEEDVWREEQQWGRLKRCSYWIDVKDRQLTVRINHRGLRSNNPQLMSP